MNLAIMKYHLAQMPDTKLDSKESKRKSHIVTVLKPLFVGSLFGTPAVLNGQKGYLNANRDFFPQEIVDKAMADFSLQMIDTAHQWAFSAVGSASGS
jgi:hypothetical protein